MQKKTHQHFLEELKVKNPKAHEKLEFLEEYNGFHEKILVRNDDLKYFITPSHLYRNNSDFISIAFSHKNIFFKDNIKKITNKYEFYILNIDDILNTKSKCFLIDKDGYKYTTTIDSILQNNMPLKFYKTNKYTISNISLWLKLNNPTIKIKENQYYLSQNKKLIFICDSCGEFRMSLNTMLRPSKCPICMNRQIKTGINDLATKRPDLIKYFKNKDDSSSHSEMSNIKVNMICPECGFEKDFQICKLSTNGFFCENCSDGIPYGEKFCLSLLNELNIEYEYQKIFNWGCNKRYDFYVPSLNMIIETHGEQHYKESGMIKNTLKEQQNNDAFKHKNAIKNGIKNYIIINCSNTNFEILKQEFVNNLNHIFDFNDINFKNIYINSIKSNVVIVSNLFDMGYNITDISKKIKMQRRTVREYLKKGVKANVCKTYSINNKISICKLSKDMEFIKKYESLKDAFEDTNVSHISDSCRGKRTTAGGFIWRYADEVEIEDNKL